ncbi:hypothetical protein [Natronorubrum bangense]|uniref:Right handed beta helix domain-containing protein n=2 Tax=Natronorubrum bangense TaxID=61858 RepID=L9W773_9EURY|nr:hypothetical protein [Natronorubrum bangense]ELY45324.1 hypothetical protein C494_15648 [Natronorubrum bangense JCM 10635]QCC56828.1 hypothetical protein DV706_20040 [Natronorubrum bangense]
MARESSVLNDSESADSEDQSADESGNSGLLHRRSYMKLAGATTAAAAAFGASASADENDYDVIRARGQVINIGRGETFENKLIDVSTGNSVLLNVTGADSVIRNIGFEGLYRGDQFLVSINADRGDILFENIYMGDGATKEGSSFVHGPGAVFMHRGNDASVTFRRCNVQGFPNNGFYCSNTASGPSSVHFDTCFGKNNGVTTFRCASGNDVIENCVAYNDNTDYGPGYGGYTETNGRPVWVWNGGTVTIRDSHFADGPYPYSLVAGANGSPGSVNFESGGYRGDIQRASGSTVSVGDAVSTSPDLSVPDGVPTSAEAAASGTASADSGTGGADSTDDEADEEDDDQLPNVILFDGDDSDVTRYEFEVDGDVEPSNYEGATIDDEAEIEDSLASGVVADWKDAFRFSGDLEELTVDGPATVLVNDEAIDPADYGDDLPHVLEVEGQGSPTSFEITVEGTIELAGDDDPEDEATTVSGSTGQSTVTDGTQTFRFSGALTDVTLIDGEATVSLDGEEIDPADYGDHEVLPHALVIDGTNASEPSTYSFEASGAVVKSTYRDATIDDEDVVEGRAVRGAVSNWLDAYWFDGDIEEFTLCGDATVDVQYNVREQ